MYINGYFTHQVSRGSRKVLYTHFGVLVDWLNTVWVLINKKKFHM